MAWHRLHVGTQKDNGQNAQQDDSDDDNSRQTERRGENERERQREWELDRGFILKHNRKTVSAGNFGASCTHPLPPTHTHADILRLANEYNQCQSIFCIALEQRVQVSKANPE